MAPTDLQQHANHRYQREQLANTALPTGPISRKTAQVTLSASLLHDLKRLGRNNPVAMRLILIATWRHCLQRHGLPGGFHLAAAAQAMLPEAAPHQAVLLNDDIPVDLKQNLAAVKAELERGLAHRDTQPGRLAAELSQNGVVIAATVDFEDSRVHEDLPPVIAARFRTDGEKLTLAITHFRDVGYNPEDTAAHFTTLLGNILSDPGKPLRKAAFLSEEAWQSYRRHSSGPEQAAKSADTIDGVFGHNVATFPGKPALIHSATRLTYRELDRLVTATARVLSVEHGVAAGDLVAVLLPRGSEAVITMLALFRLGAVYVPVDTGYPQGRRRLILEEAQARLVIYQDTALPENTTAVVWSDLQHAATQTQTTDKLPSPPQAGDPAYLLFTSGSSGRPKGVLVAHGGFCNTINHQIKTLSVKPGDRCLAFAPLGFDASPAEIFLALHAGAALYLVDDAVKLDPPAFRDFLQTNAITVATLPPAFQAVLSSEDLAGLRALISAGEAPRAAQVAALADTTAFFNAYGPTEASVCCAMGRLNAADAEQHPIPMGRPLQNTSILVLGHDHCCLPLGAVGELAVAGPGLALGYRNRDDLTEAAFIVQPETGLRVYLTGDLGRYREDGQLEFHGRADRQLKLRGNRIESGELEQALRKAGCRDALVRENDGQVWAFALGEGDEDQVRAQLADTIPEYALPQRILFLAQWPTTAHGKIDEQRLREEARSHSSEQVPPQGEAENLLAQLWHDVLGREARGVTESFFHAGGDSISALQMTARLAEQGGRLTVRDFYESPTIRGLALRIQTITATRRRRQPGDLVPLTPIQRWFFTSGRQPLHHFNQAVAIHPSEPLDHLALERALAEVWRRHPQLQVRFSSNPPQQFAGDPKRVPALEHMRVADAACLSLEETRSLQNQFDLEQGPLVRWIHVSDGKETRLILVAHHLVVDGVSWRIILADLAAAYAAATLGRTATQTPAGDDFGAWAAWLASEGSPSTQERRYWEQQCQQPFTRLPGTKPARVGQAQKQSRHLDEATTRAVTGGAHAAYGTDVNDFLLAALTTALQQMTGGDRFKIAVEGHGRDEEGRFDLSRTVGWFTSLFPVLLTPTANIQNRLVTTKETLRAVPNKGLGYGSLVFGETPTLVDPEPAQISFNFLGAFDNSDDNRMRLVQQDLGPLSDPEAVRPQRLDLIGWIHGGLLHLEMTYASDDFSDATVTEALDTLTEALKEQLAHCQAITTPQRTPSDFTYTGLSLNQLENLEARYDLEDVQPLTPMQQGVFFQNSWSNDATYFEQTAYLVEGSLDPALVQTTLAELGRRHPVTRTLFAEAEAGESLALITTTGGPAFRIRQLENEAALEAALAADRAEPFDLGQGPLVRLTLLQLSPTQTWLVWSFHHILMDGWCLGILSRDFFALLDAVQSGTVPTCPLPPDNAAWFRHLARCDHEGATNYWRTLTADIEAPTSPVTHPANAGDYQWQRHSRRLGQSRTQALQALAAELGVSLFNLVQVLWSLWLAKSRDSNDVVFGTVVSGRPADVRDIENMVGLFMNTVPVRMRWQADQSLRDTARQLAAQMSDGEPHHHVPLHEILAQSPLGNRLFDHLLIFENYPVSRTLDGVLAKHNLHVRDWRSFEQTPYPFNLSFHPGDDLEMVFECDDVRFKEQDVTTLMAQWTFLMDQWLANPDIRRNEIALCPDFHTIHGPTLPAKPTQTIADLFAEQVQTHGSRIAVIDGAVSETYVQFGEAVQQLAGRLVAAGVSPGDHVAVCISRTRRMPLTVLAVAAAGAVFVPLDAGAPQQRLQFIAEDCGARLAILEDGISVTFPCPTLNLDQCDNHPVAPLPPQPDTGQPAYLVYTSGSTGQPKGVVVSHAALSRQVQAWIAGYRLDEQRPVALQVAGFAFDVFVGDVARTLLVGGTMVVCNEHVRLDPPALFGLLQQHAVTLFEGTPGLVMPLLRWMDAEQKHLPDFRLLIVGSDVWTTADAAFARRVLPDRCRLVNSYGVTEATIDSCYFEIKQEQDLPKQGPVPIGKPLAGNELTLLDGDHLPLPHGATGRLFIGGGAVAEGYRNRPELNAARFQTIAGIGRVYATGDRAWVNDRGDVVFLGRDDGQVKVRGYRIEPGEIETALTAVEAVSAAVVIAKSQAETTALIAYLVGDGDESRVRDALHRTLPSYMVPARFVFLETLPLTPNGKVDRRALALRDDAPVAVAGRAPRNERERQIAAVFASLLDLPADAADIDRDFFEAGGHSLLVLRLIGRIRVALGTEISPQTVFANPTVAGLAAEIEANPSPSTTQQASIVPVPDADHYPLSLSQRRLWILHQMDAAEAYNVPGAFTLDGPLQVETLRRAIGEVVARHESLRTHFITVGDEARQVVSDTADVTCPVIEVADEAAVHQHAYEEANRSFDLADGPLFRTVLLRRGAQRHVLLFTLHHIIADGWSMDNLFRDIGIAYQAVQRGENAPFRPLPFQYRDYAVWSRDQLTGTEGERLKNYWHGIFTEQPPALNLPVDRRRPAHKTYHGGSVVVPVADALMTDFNEFCRRRDVTPFMGLLCALNILLYRLSGQTDLVVASPVAGRPHPDLDDQVGLFINSVALRTRFSDDMSFDDLLQTVRRTVLDALAHNLYPFDQLVADLPYGHDPSRSPLCDVMLSYVSQPHAQQAEMGDLRVGELESRFETAKLDLSFDFLQAPDGWVFSVEYNSDIYNENSALRFGQRLLKVMEQLQSSAQPDHRTLTVVPETELSRITGPAPNPNLANNVVTALLDSAAQIPTQTAVICGQQTRSFAELADQSARLARVLCELPRFQPGKPMAVLVPRGVDYPAVVLAVLRAGAVYVPLDPEYPIDRIQTILRESGTRHVISPAEDQERVQAPGRRFLSLDDWFAAAQQKEPLPTQAPDGEALAYMMFTSGSTGVPKGVAVTHANLAHTVLQGCAPFTVGQTSQARFALLAGQAFDIALLELLLPLCAGAAVEVVTREALLDADLRHAALQRCTAFHAVPALLSQILDHADVTDDFKNLRWLFTGGDRVPVALLERAAKLLPQTRVVEFYGPTETTIICTALDVRAEAALLGESACIGRPLAGVDISLRDRNDQIVPRGCVGEIHIAGPGVAQGYRNKGRLNNKPFIQNGARRYRTGDLAVCTEEGLLLFNGRADDQLKIRGIRMEPGEVERRLLNHEAVHAAAVGGRDIQGQQHLAAYLVADTDATALRTYLAPLLAEPMIPTRWFFLDELPRDNHGKIDRKALAALKDSQPESATDLKQPRNETEARLLSIWCEVLQRDALGVDQHFTEVGGHSLELTQIALRIQQQFGFKPGIRLLISHPTIESLARELENHGQQDQPEAELIRAENPNRFPATPDQQRLWVLCQFEEASRAYHLPGAFRLNGPLHREAFNDAFAKLQEHHAMLRARFKRDNDTLWVALTDTRLQPEWLDWTERTITEPQLDEVLADQATRPFDLARGPLVRCSLIQLAEERWVLTLNLHHLIADGWSLNLLLADWWAFYRHALGEAPRPEAPRYQFADYAANLQQQQADRAESDLSWWREQFATPPAPLELVTDKPRPAVKRYRGAQPSFTLPKTLWDRVTATAAQLAVTPFTVLTASVFGWAWRRSGQTDLCFGTPVSGRDQQAWEALIGLMINTTVLRTDVQPAGSFAALVGQVQEALDQAREHDAVGFAELVDAVNPPRDPGRSPLFDVFVSMFSKEGTLPDGWSYQNADYPTGQFDLSFQFGLNQGDAVLYLEYDSDLFEAETVHAMAAHWQNLLAGWTSDPAAPLDKVADEEIPAVLEGATRPLPNETVLTRFVEQVQTRPEAPVFRRGDRVLHYSTWWQRVEQLAGALTALPSPPSLVAISMPRDLEQAVALAAVWRSGAAWLPIDPDLPLTRRTLLLEDSGADVLLCTPQTRPAEAPCRILDYATNLAAGTPIQTPPPNDPEARAYLLYTSGSTGRPKGVSVSHGALRNFLAAMAEIPGCLPSDRVAAVTPLSFDISLLEWWLAPFVGASVTIFEREEVLADPDCLLQNGISLLQTTPANLALLQQTGRGLSPDLRVLCGGEALPQALAEAVLPRVAELWNMYGPTETTIWSTCTRITDPQTRIHCGTPIANTTVVVLDEQEHALPAGIRGQIAIGGAGLAHGYHQREALTQSVFGPARAKPHGPRLYRTGDVGYLDHAGRLIVLGRKDFQIKHKGHRIEPGEIEAALTDQPEIQQAAVVLQGTAPDTLLCAYLTPADGVGTVDIQTVLRRLHERLPSVMVPQRTLLLETMPLNSSGKIDRRALPRPTDETPRESRPLSAAQQELAALWRAVGVAVDREETHFFAAGGNSLRAVRLLNSMREHYGTSLALVDLFRAPTLAEQTELVARTTPVAESLPRAPQAERYRATPNQSALWHHMQQRNDDGLYLLPGAFRLKGTLDTERLKAALTAVIAAQESLRTLFEEDEDGLWFRVSMETNPAWRESDLRDQTDAEATARRWTEKEATTTMSPTTGPLLRVHLIQMAEADHLLLVTLHHLISDAWSMDLLLQQWLRAYQGEPLPTPSHTFRDVAHHLNNDGDEAAETWWRETYAAPPEPLTLASDREPGRHRDGAGDHRFIVIQPDQVAALEQTARNHNASLFHVLAAATTVFLHRYSGQEDLLLGTARAGRERAEWENMIGMFVQTPALRLKPRGDQRFADFLAAVRDHILAADRYAAGHAHLQSPETQPRVALVLQENQEGATLPDGLKLTRTELDNGSAKFDLSFTFSPQDEALRLDCSFACDLFDAATIRHRLDRFVDLLAQIAAEPTRLIHAYRMLSPTRWQQTQRCLQRIATLPPAKTHLLGRFSETALRYADRNALIDGDRRLTFADIDRLSARVAAYLVEQHGVTGGQRIGLSLSRSAEMVIGLLGILRAGAAYVPLDPDYPAERLAFFAQDAGLVGSLCDARIAAVPGGLTRFPYQEAVTHQPQGSPQPRPADAETYVIYTSGSTGTPKGVPIRDNRVAALLEQAAPLLQCDQQDVWTLFHSVAFDFSVWEIFGALLHGAALVIVPNAVARDPRRFGDLLRREHVTVLNQIPSAFNALTTEMGAEGLRLPDLRCVVFGGEALNPASLRGFAENHPHCQLVNMYGITETCVHVTLQKLNAADLASGVSDIGKALPHLYVSLLGRYGEWVPDGAAGEMCVSGLGLAEGYLARPELSAERFQTHPHHQDVTIYRSGDHARRRACGNLIYLGRADHQVKVRGHRIECGEVEAHLLAHEGVQEVAVRAVSDAHGIGTLLAWFIGRVEPGELRETARRALPTYMRPAAFIAVAVFPRTPSGKIDVAALPRSNDETHIPLQTKTEQVLAELWRDLLRLPTLPGPEADFFALGGHSLNALQLCRRVEQRLNRQAKPQMIFENPGLRDLAKTLDDAAPTGDTAVLIPRLADEAPLHPSPQQQSLWLLSQTRDTGGAYHVCVGFRLHGEVPGAGVVAALQALVNRHESLRTSFAVVEGRPRLTIAEHASVPVRFVAASEWSSEEQSAWRDGAFDLADAPLLRALVIEETPAQRQLWLCAHHLVVDGWSLELLQQQFLEHLITPDAASAEAQPEPIRYRDLAAWYHDKKDQHLAYWRDALAEPAPPLLLPQDGPREAADYRAAHTGTELTAEDVAALRRFARERQISDYSVQLGLLSLALSQLSGAQYACIGTPVAGRPLLELEAVVGYLVNSLPIQTRIAPEDDLDTFFKKVHAEVSAALDHQLIPFDHLVKELAPEAVPGRHPFFDVMLVFQNQDGVGEAPTGPIQAEPLAAPASTAKFDLTWTIMPGAETWVVDLEYRTALFHSERAETFLQSYRDMTTAVLSGIPKTVADATHTQHDDELCFELEF